MRGDPGGLRCDDVVQLQANSNVAAPLNLVNPHSFAPPIAPHIATVQSGAEIDLDHIISCFQALREMADVVLVEGVGGLMVPLNARQDIADLAVMLDLPVILIVGIRLGCIESAQLIRSDLKFSPDITKVLTIYLLVGIGLHGGKVLAKVEFAPAHQHGGGDRVGCVVAHRHLFDLARLGMDRPAQRFGHRRTLRLGEWDFPNGGSERLNTTHSISFRFIQDAPEPRCYARITVQHDDDFCHNASRVNTRHVP